MTKKLKLEVLKPGKIVSTNQFVIRVRGILVHTRGKES